MYRILVCCFNPRSVNNIHLGFMEAGCQVYPMFIGWNYEGKTELLKKRLARAIDDFKPQVVYSYGWWDIGIDLSGYFDVIKEKGIPHIFWAYDDPVCFQEISMPMAEKSDLIFTTVEECIEDYRKRSVNAHLLMHACYPELHKKRPLNKKYAHDIVLLANNYNITENVSYFEYRNNGIKNLVKPLVDNDFDIFIWGLWWTNWDRAYVIPEKYYGGFLSKSSDSSVYSSCKIALGLQTVGDSKTHLSVRTFEVMGCGAFHVSQYSPALETYFKKGVHLEWSRSAEETMEIVNFYLSKERARERIALKGQQEVYEKHTLLHRAKTVIEMIKENLHI